MDGVKEERLNKFWKYVIVVLTLIGVVISINQLFFLQLFGFAPAENTYLYYLFTCFLSMGFLLFPASKKHKGKIKWYDVVFFIVTLVSSFYLAFNGSKIVWEGWEHRAPTLAIIVSVILWILILELLRRTGGNVLSLIVLLISLYPLIADKVPIPFLQGHPYSFLKAAQSHILGSESILGPPMTSAGTLIIGFLIFGVVLTMSGGGEFFFKLAQSLLGSTRGGEAKVSILGSAFFGMLSGSAVSNVATTGPMTIPAMKKSGYTAEYAGAIEANASTGGTITPPIMGTAAFIMASFTGIAYSKIALAAIVPAALFFIGLFVQADGYAARNKLLGMPKTEKPSFIETLKSGWFYLIALVILVTFIGVLHSEAQAPYYTSLILIILSMINKKTRFNLKKFVDMIYNIGRSLSEIIAIIAGVGFVVGGLSMTGVSFSISRELISLVDGNLFLLLLAGAFTCFVLGLGMTVSASYIFLAIVFAPTLVTLGVDIIAAHLFVIYWATVSYITPPVALAAFTAANIAKAHPTKTALVAMRLGSVKYIIPFFFVYQPALIGQGEPFEIFIFVITALIGVLILGSAFEGYLIGVGKLTVIPRVILAIAGIGSVAPNVLISVISIAVIIIVAIFIRIKNVLQKSEENKYVKNEIV